MAKRKLAISQQAPPENPLNLKWIDGADVTTDESLSQWTSEDRAIIDRQTLKSLFYSEDWVYITVDSIAQPLSRIPWLVYRKVMSNGKVTYLPDEAHPLNKLLENPTQDIDATTFKYMLFCEDALMGNSIVWYARTKNELHIIPTETCDYVFDFELGRPSALKINAQQEQMKAVTLPINDLIHIMRPHVSNKWWGLSPFIPTRKSLLFQKYFQDSSNAHYQRGAQPQAILKMDKEANEQNATRLLKKFEAAYAGRKNMRRTMILPKGVDFTSVDMTIADPSTIELVTMNRENILNALHIPKHVVSLNQAGSLGSEEFKQALKYFWSATLIPISERVAGKFTKFFAKELGPDRVIGFDFDSVEVLQDDKLKQALLAKEMLTTMTINEVRDRVWQMAAVADGDVIGSLIPPPFAPPQTFGIEEPATAVQAPPEVQEEKTEEILVQKNSSWFEKRATMLTTHHAVMAAEEKGKGKHYESFALGMIQRQNDVAVKLIQKGLQQKAYEFDEDQFSKDYDDLIAAQAKKAAEDHAQLLKNSMELGYRSQLSGVFNEKDNLAISALRNEGANGRLGMLNSRGLDLFKYVSATTREQAIKKTRLVLESVASGVEANKTIKEIAEDISQYLGGNAMARAKVIARTEVLTAVSFGQEAMHRDAKTVIPGLKKIWLNAGDDRVRGNPGGKYPSKQFDHWDVHGEAVLVDEKFSNGLRFPRDPEGKAGNTIQCRCTQLVIAPEDADIINVPSVGDIPNRP